MVLLLLLTPDHHGHKGKGGDFAIAIVGPRFAAVLQDSIAGIALRSSSSASSVSNFKVFRIFDRTMSWWS